MATCMERNRHQEWLKFLRLVDRQTPADKQPHLIVDNHATHKHPAVQRWAERHKRFHFHFTPTSSSWLNKVHETAHGISVDFFQHDAGIQKAGNFNDQFLYQNCHGLIDGIQ
jgi:hypothetical protein